MIIAIHGVLSYVGFDQFWSYADVQEVTLYPVTEIILFAVIGPFALFMIALLVVAEVKALVVAGGGVAASFALAWLLISRVPGIPRVL
jgi:hypothetical protein